jgi:pimeloyl-ACP methyl ester carboxylesterase
VRKETVPHDGRDTAYRFSPSEGRAVVCVHGSGATGRVWGHQLRGLDRPAAAPDLSGHGDSDDVSAEPGPAALSAYADDVLAVAREVDAGAVVGNSLGGAVALHALLDRDHPFEAAVLCGTGAKLAVAAELRELLAGEFEAAIETLHRPGMLFQDADPATVERSRAAMRSVGRATVERDFLTCHAFDVRDRLDEVGVPVLAVTGEHDRLTPVQYHEFIAEQVADGRLAVIEDAAHLSFAERPGRWNDRVGSFL